VAPPVGVVGIGTGAVVVAADWEEVGGGLGGEVACVVVAVAGDVAVDDVAVDDVAVDDVAVDDVAVDDVAVNDVAVNDVAVNDVPVDDVESDVKGAVAKGLGVVVRGRRGGGRLSGIGIDKSITVGTWAG